MRILRIRFKNLNALRGEWEIDLTHPEFSGLFAITGPTGAGKTTLLDAICLALYGRTPRLAKLSKNSNELMSRQTGECFAEVTFATMTGNYTCHWSQHRARKSAQGELQVPKHELSNADTGRLLESSLKGTAEQIITLTGMDFDRFTRSMLLAQGAFSAFLHASADERAPILEQITGSDIYSSISIKVHEYQRGIQEQRNQLISEMAGINLLTSEQEAEYQQAVATGQAQIAQLTQTCKTTEMTIQWLDQLDQLRQDLSDLALEEQQLFQAVADFAPQRQQLQWAQKADTLSAEYARLTSLRDQQTQNQHRLPQLQIQLKQQTDNIAQLMPALTQAEEHTRDAKSAMLKDQPARQQARLLDQEITRITKDHTHLQQQIAQTQTTLTKAEQKLAKQVKQHQEQQDNLLQQKQQKEQHLQHLLAGRLLREYRQEKEGLLRELALLQRIAELSEQRHNLSDGQACPLCGATHHPFAEGNVPTPNATEARIQQLSELIVQVEQTQEALQHIDEQHKQLTTQGFSLQQQAQQISQQKNKVTQQQSDLTLLTQQLADMRQQRIQCYGEQAPDAREHALQTAVNSAEQAEKVLRQRYQTQQQAWHNTQTQINSLTQTLAQVGAQLTPLEADFLMQIKQIGFDQEADFLSACLSKTQITELNQRTNDLDTRQTMLKTKRQERESRLQSEESRQLTQVTRETLTASLHHDQQQLMQQQETLASLKHQLTENAIAAQRLHNKQQALNTVEKDYQSWSNLHALIGSADGKKYRNFAQGLTFNLLVHHANQQLQTMSDRYLLIRDAQQLLELNVIDSYQAGEIRSTKNLSGGESFIISLALALGLSQMASHKVRVDSLFLDEGFGTLDEEALETALDTLANLQQDGKLIGIISHVSALKERITAQIKVTRQTGGKSTLSGIGCRKINAD